MKSLGRVKWFKPEKDYGFIVPDEGGGDVFIKPGMRTAETNRKLVEDALVSFDMEFGEGGKASAVNLVVLS